MGADKTKKRTILIIMGRYLPGYKDGGPVRSIKNLVDALGGEYNFRILTCDRDHGDDRPYGNIKANDWNPVGKAFVYYVPPGGFKRSLIRRLAKEADLVYVCGCFNDYARNTMLENRLGRIKVPVVVATMGLFSPGEFQLKYRKKKLFTTVFQMLGMFRNVYFSVTSEMEAAEVRQQIRAGKEQFLVAEDLPRKVSGVSRPKKKEAGQLKIVWISRIAPKKNLLGAVRMLSRLPERLEEDRKKESPFIHSSLAEGGGGPRMTFTIYGPVHSQEYWQECREELKKLPPFIRWEYKGSADSEQVVEILSDYHVFFFPTLGENYGHVIQEALSSGCACILSDQTPWKDLEEKGAGCVLALAQEEAFQDALLKYASMGQEEFQKVSDASVEYACRASNQKAEKTGYRTIFELTGKPAERIRRP